MKNFLFKHFWSLFSILFFSISLFLISDQVIAKKSINNDAVEDISFQSVLDSNSSLSSKPINELGKETNLYYPDNYDKPAVNAHSETDKPYFIPLLLIISLALVVIVMVLSNALINRSKEKNAYAKPTNAGNSGIEVVDVVNIDATKSLYLIQYAGKKVLMAGSWNSFSVVSKFSSEAKSEEEMIFPRKINKIPVSSAKSESVAITSNLDFLTNTIDEEIKSDDWGESIIKINTNERKDEKIKNSAKNALSDYKVNNNESAKYTDEVKKIRSLEISKAEDTLFEEVDLLVKAHSQSISKNKNKSVQETIPNLIEKEIVEMSIQSDSKQNTIKDAEKIEKNIPASQNQDESISETSSEGANLSLSAKLANNGYKPSWSKDKELNKLNTISEEIKKLNIDKSNINEFNPVKSSSGDDINKPEDIKPENKKAEFTNRFESKYSGKFASKFDTANNFNKSKMFNTLNFQDKKAASKSSEQSLEASTGNSKFIRENQEIIDKFQELKKEYEKEVESRNINQNTQNNSQNRKATTTIRKISIVEE